MRGMWTKLYPTVYQWEIGRQDDPAADGLLPGDLLRKDTRGEQLAALAARPLPPQLSGIEGEVSADGVLVRIGAGEGERYYGLGLQLFSFLQNGKRRRLGTNADAVADTGESHAPVPFFLSSDGYGVLIDAAQTVEIDFGCSRRLRQERTADGGSTASQGQSTDDDPAAQLAGATTEELYATRQQGGEVTVFLKGASFLRLYCFAAGSLKAAVEQYNLFSGGGCLPPLWGLGSLYRCYTKADQAAVEALIRQFDREKMPFSMVGLEPGWHSHSYSCSFTFSQERFPDPDRLIGLAREKGMQVNVWEQAYVHPTAPFYEEIKPHSGDYEVWDGAVPDFAQEQAREIYGNHQETLIRRGIGAVKLDECDGSDYTGGWFFPDYARFPSGLDGEAEKNLYGAMVTRAIQAAFERQDKRTWSQVRANYSYGAPMPYVLYSDLYDHGQFVRALCNAGLSGLLWTPEVRQCQTAEELLRRTQTVVFSPLSQIDAWMIPNPPWKQYEIEKNKENVLLADDSLQRRVRELLQLRNRLVPYLYTAFYFYEKEGTPPFRPLLLDFPQEEGVWKADDCYMMGDSLLVAPILVPQGGETVPEGRDVYLPGGGWYDFWTGARYEGGRAYWIETADIPVFVRENRLLVLAQETEAPGADSVFTLDIRAYGPKPEPFWLVEDDGESYAYRRGAQRLLEIEAGGAEAALKGSARYRFGSYREF